MNIEWVRQHCLSHPHTIEQIQWGSDLLFKVGGKMFAGVPLEPARVWLTLKADPEEFPELIERQGVIPAPYLARAKWIAIETERALPRAEVLRLVSKSYELVFANLTKKLQEELTAGKKKSGAPQKMKAKNTRPHKKGSKK
ncbi:MAG TPA: MmcQ/YjbR family DNA-binding protein [Candidatus Acidoferrales bacterium]